MPHLGAWPPRSREGLVVINQTPPKPQEARNDCSGNPYQFLQSLSAAPRHFGAICMYALTGDP